MRNEPQVRRAVILAAGQSRRLETLKLDRPKPLLEVAGKPLLFHHLERCATEGVTDVFINLFHRAEQIREAVGDGARFGLRVHYHLEPELAGTAGGVRAFAEELRGEPFFVLYGDNFCTFPLREVVEAHFRTAPRPAMSIVLFELADVSQSGVAVCAADGRIISFIEKPAPGTTDSHWVNAGVYVIEPELLATFPDGPCDFGRELIPAWLTQERHILGVKTQGRVHAVDTPELLQRLPAKLRGAAA